MSPRKAPAEREDELEHTGGARNEKEKLLRAVGDVDVCEVDGIRRAEVSCIKCVRNAKACCPRCQALNHNTLISFFTSIRWHLSFDSILSVRLG
jgi:hypothetical protein